MKSTKNRFFGELKNTFLSKIVVLLAILALSIMLIGCTQSSDNPYTNYNSQQGGAAPVVGGGCGVSESADYAGTPNVDGQAGF